MKTLGKMLQVAGLVLLPVAMLMQLSGGIRAPAGGFTVSAMLLAMVLGVTLFALGRLLEGYAR